MPAAEDSFGLVGVEVEGIRFDEMVDVGGFGLVYRGRHLGLDEPVAVKCLKLSHGLPAELAESFYQRFRDETRIAYRLSQGNLDIVRSISSGTLRSPKTGLDVPYMVLEWLDGRTLNAELKARRLRGKPGMSLDETVQLLDSAVTAVAYAQDQGVVHRDLKPGNLFITETRSGPRLKVLDFGLAKIVAPDAIVQPSHQSDHHVYICSPSYGAPEQFSTKFGDVGPWTDVYSIALIMLEMLAGKKARPADNLSHGMLLAIDPETASPSAKSLGLTLPQGVDLALSRAVSQETKARPKDAREFWNAIRDGMLNVADLGATLANEGLPAQALLDEALARQERDAARVSAPESMTAPMPPNAPLAATNLLRTVGLPGSPVPAAGRPSATPQMGASADPKPGMAAAARTLALNSPVKIPPSGPRTHRSPAAGIPAQNARARTASGSLPAQNPAQNPRTASGSLPAQNPRTSSGSMAAQRPPVAAGSAPTGSTAPMPPARLPPAPPQQQQQQQQQQPAPSPAQRNQAGITTVKSVRPPDSGPRSPVQRQQAPQKSGAGAVIAVIAIALVAALGAGMFIYLRRHK